MKTMVAAAVAAALATAAPAAAQTTPPKGGSYFQMDGVHMDCTAAGPYALNPDGSYKKEFEDNCIKDGEIIKPQRTVRPASPPRYFVWDPVNRVHVQVK